MNNNHLPTDIMTLYVNGELDETAVGPILAHLAECAVCLDQVEQLWVAHLPDKTAPPLDVTTARRLEKAVFKRIHAGDFGGEVVRIGTQGFFQVFQALLRPFVRMQKPDSNQ